MIEVPIHFNADELTVICKGLEHLPHRETFVVRKKLLAAALELASKLADNLEGK